jgi:hypothetical protein
MRGKYSFYSALHLLKDVEPQETLNHEPHSNVRRRKWFLPACFNRHMAAQVRAFKAKGVNASFLPQARMA